MAERCDQKRKLKKRFQVISSISKFANKHGKFILGIILGIVLLLCGLDHLNKRAEQRKMQREYEQSFEAKMDRGKDRIGVFFSGIGVSIKGGWCNVTDFFEDLF